VTDALKKTVAEWMEARDLDAIRDVLAGYPAGALARSFKRFFPRHDPEATRLVAAPLKSLTDTRVLERLETILERRPKIVELLLTSWLDANQDALEALAEGTWPFEEPPPTAFWQAAGRFLDATGVHPSWAWFGRLKHPDPLPPPPEPKPDKDEVRHKIYLAKVERLQSRLHAQQVRCEEEAARLRSKISDLERRLSELEAEKLNLDKRYRQAERRLAGATGRIEALTRARDALKGELAAYKEKAQTLKEAREACEGALNACREALEARPQLPFAPEEVSGAWIIPYAELATTATSRLLGLIELYQAALADREHRLFAATNWSQLDGQPKGLLLLDSDRLLHDLSSLPLDRWLTAALFESDTYLKRVAGKLERALLEER